MAALRWHGCGTHGARCSSLRVPLNWSHPDRASIAIGVTELRASGPAPSLGVLFFSPGGPGGGDRQIVRDDARQYFSAAIRRRFDIVGVDPRGVSPSRPAIRCGPPTRSTTVTETPSRRAGYLRLQAYDRRVGRACLTHTGPLLDHVDTVSAARDLDAVRAVLHVRRVSWFGVSYGTLLGATYAHLFPAHVRAAVLDGTLDHTVGSARLALDEARSAESEFGRFAHWCDTHARCALHGRDVGATYRALLTRARRHPVPAPGFAHGATADEIGYGTYGLMEIRARWPLIAEGIAAAVAPHPNAGLFIRAGVPEDAAYRATTCLDSPSSIHDYAQFRSLLERLRQAAPVTDPYVEGWDVSTGCMGWPVRATNPWGPVNVTGTPPLLVVGDAHDPSTPRVWARGLARQIAGSRLLLGNGSGHTGYFNDPSVRAREVAYLLAPMSPVPGSRPARP